MPDTATLPVMLKALRLPAFTQHWQHFEEVAQDQGWSRAQFLAELCEHELAERETRRIRRLTQQSQLPTGKTLDAFDFRHAKGLDRARITALAKSTAWVEQAQNLLLFGPSGVGKSHLASAIGHALIERGMPVRYVSATALVQHLQRAREVLSLPEALAKLDKYRVLIVDDLAYVKKSEHETSVLFELIAHRYETASLVITANQPFSAWDEVFSDTIMTVAAVDRLVHHATIIEFNNDSYRQRIAKAKTKTTTTGGKDSTSDN